MAFSQPSERAASPTPTRRRAALEPWTPGQRNCALAFGVAAVLWLLPGVVAMVAPDSPARKLLTTRLDEAVVAVFAATLLFLLPTDWSRRTFTHRVAAGGRDRLGHAPPLRRRTLAGCLMFESGLAKVIGTGLAEALGAQSRVAVVALAAVLGLLLSELTSNTAATNMVVPVVISLAQARGLDPTRAGDRDLLRRQPRLHAADLDAAQRDGLRHRDGPDRPHVLDRRAARPDRVDRGDRGSAGPGAAGHRLTGDG